MLAGGLRHEFNSWRLKYIHICMYIKYMRWGICFKFDVRGNPRGLSRYITRKDGMIHLTRTVKLWTLSSTRPYNGTFITVLSNCPAFEDTAAPRLIVIIYVCMYKDRNHSFITWFSSTHLQYLCPHYFLKNFKTKPQLSTWHFDILPLTSFSFTRKDTFYHIYIILFAN